MKMVRFITIKCTCIVLFPKFSNKIPTNHLELRSQQYITVKKKSKSRQMKIGGDSIIQTFAVTGISPELVRALTKRNHAT